MSGKNWLTTGGLIGFLAVLLGAFGAHGIEGAITEWYELEDLSSESPTDETADKPIGTPDWYKLDQLHQKKLKTWITGVRYHFYHTFAILVIGLITLSREPQKSRWLDIAGWLFVLGILGFSGSIYLLVISKIKILGLTAALGGVILLCGWLFFVLGTYLTVVTIKQKHSPQE